MLIVRIIMRKRFNHAQSSEKLFRKNLYFFYEIIKIYILILLYLFCFCVRAYLYVRTQFNYTDTLFWFVC
jgi:hypothetical protein